MTKIEKLIQNTENSHEKLELLISPTKILPKLNFSKEN